MAEENVPDEVVSRFLRTFTRFHRVFMDANKREAPCSWHKQGDGPQIDIRHSERELMFIIKETEKQFPQGVSVSELSRIMCVKPPSITAPLNSLVAFGLVSREQDNNDRRMVRVHVTEKGKILLTNRKKMLYDRTRRLMESLGTQKAEQMVTIMEDIFAYFEKEMQEHPHEHP
ncbi:MAG: MarR family transcriptional regulator [Ethanoligenens sp.]